MEAFFICISCAILSVAYCLYLFKDPDVNSDETLINAHGVKYQFIKRISGYYSIRFYDCFEKKWIYILWDIDNCKKYEKRAFDIQKDNSKIINKFKSIEDVKKFNKEIIYKVEATK